MTMRDPANWSDPPTADQIAWAIVAACREVGADPIEVASGKVARGPRDAPLTRGRAYAAKALAKVFTSYPRTRIALFVGARGLVAQSYFRSLDQRLRSPAGGVWWDESVLARVVEVITGGGDVRIVSAVDASLMSDQTKRKVGEYLGVAIYEVPKLPAAKPVAKPVAKAPAADLEDDSDPVFDRGSLAGLKKPQDHRPRAMSKAEMQADLEDALRRTALMQKPED